jgi:hypothetical protein
MMSIPDQPLEGFAPETYATPLQSQPVRQSNSQSKYQIELITLIESGRVTQA